MKTVEINLFKYDEFSEEIKEKILQEHYDININHNWYDFTYEDAKEVGIKIKGFSLDRDRHIKGDPIEEYSEIKKLIINNHGKECETYKTVNNYDLRKEGEGEKMFRSLLQDYLNLLEKEFEFLTSREGIEGAIRANEYDFTADGKMF